MAVNNPVAKLLDGLVRLGVQRLRLATGLDVEEPEVDPTPAFCTCTHADVEHHRADPYGIREYDWPRSCSMCLCTAFLLTRGPQAERLRRDWLLGLARERQERERVHLAEGQHPYQGTPYEALADALNRHPSAQRSRPPLPDPASGGNSATSAQEEPAPPGPGEGAT